MPFEQQTLTALEKCWLTCDQRDITASAAFCHPQNMLPLHGKHDPGEPFKDGVMSFVCSENDEFENLLNDPKHQIVRSDLIEQLARRQMDLSDLSPICSGNGS